VCDSIHSWLNRSRSELKGAILDQPVVSDFFFTKASIPGLVRAACVDDVHDHHTHAPSCVVLLSWVDGP